MAMVTFFLPRIAKLFKHYDDLPLPTQALIWISDTANEYWLWVLLPLALVIAIFRRLVRIGGHGDQQDRGTAGHMAVGENLPIRRDQGARTAPH